MKNFHLPRIADWLHARKKAARRKAVLEYATRMAGTRFDLDPGLEAAAIDELATFDRKGK